VRENIALGDPEHADDDERVREAAALGGAEELIANLPEGYDTFLDRPVSDKYSGLPGGTTTFSGRTVDYTDLRHAIGSGRDSNGDVVLSGGQMQRLAV